MFTVFHRWLKYGLLLVGGCALLACAVGPAQADDPATENLLQRLERLEKQNEALRQKLEKLENGATAPLSAEGGAPAEGDLDTKKVQKIVGDYLKTQEKEKKSKEAEAKAAADEAGFEVGKDLSLKTRWDNGVWFETADKAFRIHVGGRTQFDALWLHAPDNVQFGVGGTGRLRDAVNFRRARLEMDGWMYEVVDFFCEYDFVNTVNSDATAPVAASENNVINVPAPTDLWAGINFIPWFGTFRAGNMKPPISLEHLTSSRYLDFIERSLIFDPYFNRNNGFSPGIQLINWTENERVNWHLGMFKSTNNVFGWQVGDGEYQVNGRVTWCPWYEHNGRCMMHLGIGVQYDEPDQSTAILRQRIGLRNGPAALHNTIALAVLNGNEQFIAVPEFFMNLGPLSIQAEYLVNNIREVRAFTTQPQGTVGIQANPRSFFSHGGYVQALYFLTGEHRSYGRTGLHSTGAAPTRIVPISNFFWTRGAFSPGAWQVGARYAYSDLSNNGIFGGQCHEGTLGLNWFLNPNMKFQWNYLVGYRGQLGVTPGIPSNGTYQGFGTRLAFDW